MGRPADESGEKHPESLAIRAALLGSGETGRETPLDRALYELKSGSDVVWVLMSGADKWEVERILQGIGFDSLSIEDALSAVERPILRVYPDYLLLGAAAVEITGDTERYVEVSCYVGPNFILVYSQSPIPEIEHTFDRWLKNCEALGREPGIMLSSILDVIVDGYFPAVDRMEETVDDLESSLYVRGAPVLQTALDLKRRLLAMRRNIVPIRDIANALLRRDLTLISHEARNYLQEIYNHTLRVIELGDINREIIASVLDAHLALVSNNLSTVMKRLTVMATVLMTLGLMTGIFGMNFPNLPLLGHPSGFWIVLGGMALVATLEVVLFRRFGWW